jgi:hypothetical protein
MTIEKTATINDLYNKARVAIESGEKTLKGRAREAAEYLAKALELGATQREAAEAIGKSPGWVNALLQWRVRGYITDFPFPRAARSRFGRRRHVQPAEQKKSKRIPKEVRELLVKALGMLGSDHAGERDSAARTVEKQRARLNMGWDELIVEADMEFRHAA